MNKAMSRAVLFAVVSVAAAGTSHAQSGTYRCVDERGRSTYTNVREEMTGKKCNLVSREVSVVSAPPPGQVKSVAPAPKDNNTNAASRSTDRRRILQDELGDEEKRLAEARNKLAEQESIRTGDERNYQRVLDRLKPYQDTVEQHEKNIAQLRRELGAIR